MAKYLKNLAVLLGIGLTAVIFIQLLEFPFHREFMRFGTLFLPLFLLSSALFLILGGPLLTSVLAVFSMAALFFKHSKHFDRFERFVLPWSFLVLAVFIFKFQQFAIAKAALKVGEFYNLSLGALLAVVFALIFWRPSRRVLAALGLAVLLCMSAGRALNFHTPVWSKQVKGPNVLLLVADTLRRDHTSIYGYHRDTTPYLAGLAQEAAVFEDTLSMAAWTKPAMAGLLTSRYLERDRVFVGPFPIEWDGIRLPEFFYRSGYDTALFTANPNTGSYFEATRGTQWIKQALPPDHFALETFVLPKMLDRYLRMQDWLKFRNSESHLQALKEELGFRSMSELSKFEYRQIEAKLEDPAESEDYRKEVKKAVRDYGLFNIRIKKKYPVWRLQYLIPYGDPLYRAVLKFCFMTLEGASGDLEGHWINDSELSRSFIDWYEKHYDRKKPFFAHLQYMGPHTPYKSQVPYLLPYFDRKSELNIENPPSQHTLPSQGAKEMSPDGLHNLVANYDDDVRNTDANIKSVVEYLRSKGELENTIIVFASDHGEAFYEHKIYGHMYSLHAELVNVPLFFYWPGKIKPGRLNTPASLIDIFPTLISVTGLESERARAGDLEGMSLLTATGEPADTGQFTDRIRYASTRVSTGGKGAKGRGRKKAEPKVEAIHRMVVRHDQKLVEEIEDKKSRYFVYSLKDWKEPRLPKDAADPVVTDLSKLFRPLPPQYIDENEPDIDVQPDKGEPGKADPERDHNDDALARGKTP